MRKKIYRKRHRTCAKFLLKGKGREICDERQWLKKNIYISEIRNIIVSHKRKILAKFPIYEALVLMQKPYHMPGPTIFYLENL